MSPAAALALIGIINVWMHLPFTFVLLYTALLAIPPELHEAARIDGARAWGEFRRITLPSLTPAILVALLFRYIVALRLFSEAWLLTRGGPAPQHGGRRRIPLPRRLPLRRFRRGVGDRLADDARFAAAFALLPPAECIGRCSRKGDVPASRERRAVVDRPFTPI